LDAKTSDLATGGNESVVIVYFVKTKAAVSGSQISSLEDKNDPRGVPSCAAVCRAFWDRAEDGFVLFLGAKAGAQPQ
jgi:hypothetical protein